MQNDIRRSEKGNAAYLNVSVWYEAQTGHIHLTLPNSDWFHTTVNGDENSKRGHPNLFAKLARVLKEAGVPGPEVSKTD